MIKSGSNQQESLFFLENNLILGLPRGVPPPPSNQIFEFLKLKFWIPNLDFEFQHPPPTSSGKPLHFININCFVLTTIVGHITPPNTFIPPEHLQNYHNAFKKSSGTKRAHQSRITGNWPCVWYNFHKSLYP